MPSYLVTGANRGLGFAMVEELVRILPGHPFHKGRLKGSILAERPLNICRRCSKARTKKRAPQETKTKTKTLTLTDLCAAALHRPQPRQAAPALVLAPVLAALVALPLAAASLVPESQPEARVLLGPTQVDMEHALGV